MSASPVAHNVIGLRRIGNHANRSRRHSRFFANPRGKRNLVSRPERNLTLRHLPARRYIHKVDAMLLSSFARSTDSSGVPATLAPSPSPRCAQTAADARATPPAPRPSPPAAAASDCQSCRRTHRCAGCSAATETRAAGSHAPRESPPRRTPPAAPARPPPQTPATSRAISASSSACGSA